MGASLEYLGNNAVVVETDRPASLKGSEDWACNEDHDLILGDNRMEGGCEGDGDEKKKYSRMEGGAGGSGGSDKDNEDMTGGADSLHHNSIHSGGEQGSNGGSPKPPSIQALGFLTCHAA